MSALATWPCELVLPPDAPRDLWLGARDDGIGGSDLAVILGLARFGTELNLWHDKTGDAFDIDNERMEWGRRSESMILAKYREMHPELDVQESPGLLRSKRCAIALGTPDALAGTVGDVIEIKTGDRAVLSDWADGATPAYYVLQVLWYLGITGGHTARFAVLIGGNKYLERTVTTDPNLPFDYLADRAMDWWDRHVIAGVPPEPRRQDMALLRRIYRDTEIESADISEYADDVSRLVQLQDIAKSFENEADEIKARLIGRMAGATEGYIGTDLAVTWRYSKAPFYIDDVQLKAEFPDVYKAVRKQKARGSRPLNITKSTRDQIRQGISK